MKIFIQAMPLRKPFIAFCLTLVCGHAAAGEWQSIDDIVKAVEQFVQQKTADSPNEISVTVTRPDSRLRLNKCDNLETRLPSGNRLWGRASVAVHCTAPSPWSLYVPVMVRVSGSALIAARAIASGQTLEAQDVQLQIRDLTQSPGGVLIDPHQAIGKTTASSIKAGDLLRPEQLRSPLAIKQGQQVILVAQGAGFKVSSEGQAMGNAAVGQVVSVKTRSGQIIKGVAKGDGVVEVYF